MRLALRFLILLTLTLFSLTKPALCASPLDEFLEINSKFHSALPEERKELEKKGCELLLELSQIVELPKLVPSPGNPYLYLFEDETIRYPKEVISSARYAQYVHRHYGETVALTTEVGAQETSAVDGFVRDKNGKAVATYSLKVFTSKRHVLRTIGKAIHITLPNFININYLFNKHMQLHTAKSRPVLDAAKQIKLMGVTQTSAALPIRIVADCSDVAAAIPEDEAKLESLKVKLQAENSPIESILFMRPGGLYRLVTKDGIYPPFKKDPPKF